jgi:hypothetical protein
MESYALLTKVEREQALSKIFDLVRLKLEVNFEFDHVKQELPQLSLVCAKTILSMSGHAQNKNIKFVNSLDHVCSKLAVESNREIFILSRQNEAMYENEIWLSFLWKYLGGDGISSKIAPSVIQLKKDMSEALLVIQQLGLGTDLIKRNTGLVVPFPCTSPESGSGTSKLLPGCLMLPSGVPIPLLAECWFHECMHTELYLAEWLSGQELATSDKPISSPWRTSNRSANLLLHGCFVFYNLVKFIRLARKHYVSIEGSWQLSAAKGKAILVRDVENVCDFRVKQVKEALEILGSQATFSLFGKIVYERVSTEISAW